MNAAEKLALYGVDVRIEDGNLKLSGLGDVPDADRDAVNALIEEAKAHKAELVEALRYTVPRRQQPTPQSLQPRVITSADEFLLEVCRKQAEHIKQSEEVRAALLQGLQRGKDTGDLLRKACHCISLMTGDSAFMRCVEQEVGTNG